MPGKPLAVREDPQRGVCVSGLTLHKVSGLICITFHEFLSSIVKKYLFPFACLL